MPGPPTFEPVVESRVKVSINGWKRSRDFGIKTPIPCTTAVYSTKRPTMQAGEQILDLTLD